MGVFEKIRYFLTSAFTCTVNYGQNVGVSDGCGSNVGGPDFWHAAYSGTNSACVRWQNLLLLSSDNAKDVYDVAILHKNGSSTLRKNISCPNCINF